MEASPFDAWMVRRFRRLYARASGFTSPTSGYAGLVEEMQHALRALSRERRLELDAIVLPRVLGGPLAPLVRLSARRFPRAFTACFVRATPMGLRYLIGPSERVSRHEIEIPRCRFLAEGGPALCADICKAPTEHFFAREYLVSIRFAPDLERGRCRLTFAP